MKLPNLPPVYLVAGAVIAGALAWVAWKGPRGAGESLGGALVDAVDGVASGVVNGVGGLVGLPSTSKSECQLAVEKFRALPWYDQAQQSFVVSARCSAGDYLRFIGTGKGPQDL